MASTKKKTTASTPLKPDVFVYIGPSVHGTTVTNGAIFFGVRAKVEEHLRLAIETYPEIRQLIVPDTQVAEARKKIENRDGLTYATYRRLELKLKRG